MSCGTDFPSDLHGLVIYPASWRRSNSHMWESNALHTAKIRANNEAHFRNQMQFAVASSAQPASVLTPHHEAAIKLFSKPQYTFTLAADNAARKFTKQPITDHSMFSHMHGITSWGDTSEPALATVFRKPIGHKELQRIGTDVGTWARQHGVLIFHPTESGQDELLHMRVRTHPRMQRLTPHRVAAISKYITDAFNSYYEGDPSMPTIPGRTILPDVDGYSDVLTLLPPWERNKNRLRSVFAQIAQNLQAETAPQSWVGHATMLGGMTPNSDEFSTQQQDEHKRRLTLFNREPQQFEKDRQPRKVKKPRSPAKTGVVVRGVYYPPGKFFPEIESAGGGQVQMSAEDLRNKIKAMCGPKQPIKNSWEAGRTSTGNVKAVGIGEDNGKTLYGDDAKRALENSTKAKSESYDTEQTHAASEQPQNSKVSPSELKDLLNITPPSETKAWHKIVNTYATVRNIVAVQGVELGLLASKLAPSILDTSDDYLTGKHSQFGMEQGAFHETFGMSIGFMGTLIQHAIATAFKLHGMLKGNTPSQLSKEIETVESAAEALTTLLQDIVKQLDLPITVDGKLIYNIMKSKVNS